MQVTATENAETRKEEQEHAEVPAGCAEVLVGYEKPGRLWGNQKSIYRRKRMKTVDEQFKENQTTTVFQGPLYKIAFITGFIQGIILLIHFIVTFFFSDRQT